MTVGKGLKVNLFASEKEFPELAKPVQMSFDAKGRLWVAVLADLSALEAQGGDERQAPDLRGHRRRRQGRQDDRLRRRPALPDRLRVLQRRRPRRPGARPDVPQGHRRRRQGRRPRARAHRPRLGRHAPHVQQLRSSTPAAALYFQEGTFHHTQVETPYGPPVRCVERGRLPLRAAVRRSSRSTSPTASPTRTATSSTAGARTSSSTAPAPIPTTAPCSRPRRLSRTSTPSPPQVYQQRTRPCPGIEILSSRHFPEEFQGNLLVANVIGFQGILQLQDRGQGRQPRRHRGRADPLVAATRTSARPTSKIGPGRRHLLPRLAEPDHRPHAAQPPRPQPRPDPRPGLPRHLRGPAAARSPPKIAGEPIEKLLDLLKEPEDRVRYRARIELGGRDDRRGHRRARRRGSPSSTRPTPIMSTT